MSDVVEEDFELASGIQQREISSFIDYNADELSQERILQVQCFALQCENIASRKKVMDLEAELEMLMIQEHADQNMVRRMAEPPLPPLPPLVLPSQSRVRVKDDLEASSSQRQEDDAFGDMKLAAEDPMRDVGLTNIRNGHALEKQVAKVCVSCDTESYIYAEAPCADGHVFCNNCLAKLFSNAIVDRSLLPIRCCRIEMDQNVARFVLSEAEFESFAQIQYEEETKNKMFW
jgi:hypothetical protein